MIEGVGVYSKPDVEMALLHPMVHGEERAKKWALKLDDSLFNIEAHRRIFRAARELYAAGKKVDLVTIDEKIPNDMFLVAVEISRTPGYVDLYEQYIEILEDAKKRRELYVFTKQIRDMCGDRTVEPEEIIAQIRNFSAMFREKKSEESLLDAMMEAYNEMFEDKTKKYCQVGIESIDKRLGGLEPGTLTVIGARPGVGKSIIGMNILMHNGANGKKCLLVNREMVKKNFARRMVSERTGMDTEIMKRGNLTGDDPLVAEFLNGVAEIKDMPVDVLNWPSRPSHIRAAVIERMEDSGLDLLVIDYLQRLDPDGRFKNRNEAIGAITWALKDIAMTYKIPVVLLSQLNRDAANKRPTISNLRESGDIEQDADQILLLHEPDEIDVNAANAAMYAACKENGWAFIEAILGKNREGTKTITPLIRVAQKMKLLDPKEAAWKANKAKG
jgi:replicative DNA helicase